ncbi:hypothetical protein JCM33374_g4960 [Metschnikowia sp. JCM 33374]|nr:hypothetical protein JCM33374_g4960 [Metschnikowia sp. JCM 33374]
MQFKTSLNKTFAFQTFESFDPARLRSWSSLLLVFAPALLCFSSSLSVVLNTPQNRMHPTNYTRYKPANQDMYMLQCFTLWPPGGPDPKVVPVIDVFINEDYASSALYSSATNVDFISEKLVNEIGAKKYPIPFRCGCQTNSPQVVPIYETVDLKFDINGITTYRTCYVFPKLYIDLIFGFEFGVEFASVMDIENRTFNGLPMYE